MSDEIVVSLVVPVRNEEQHIGACLRSVANQTFPASSTEVILVDGQSDDRTLELAEQHASEIPHFRILSNQARDLPNALNIGVRGAVGRYIGYVHGHSILPRDYVARVVQVLEERGAWSVGGRIVRRTDGPMHRAIALAVGSPIGVGDSSHNFSTMGGWAETAFPGFWRREVFDRVGLFDPSMVSNEDNELSLRIRRAGGGIWYEPSIAVEYVPRSTLGGLFHQYRAYGLGKMRLLRKYRGGLRWRHVIPAAWVGGLCVGAVVAVLVPDAALVWAGAIAVYVAVIVATSVRLAAKDAQWWRIALALGVVHLGYGLGTWQGVFTWRR